MNLKTFVIFVVCIIFAFGTFALSVEDVYKKLSAEEIKVLYTFLALTASAGEYALAHGSFPNLEQLEFARKPVTDAPYLEKTILADAHAAGYTFSFIGEGTAYVATAVSLEKKGHSFYKDEHVFCVSDEVDTAVSTAHAERGCPVGFSQVTASPTIAPQEEESSIGR
ncbi:MAG: hypothetical protein ABH865_09580 [Candidatus Omnitrophota bacterium]|nr:hypothetical protein [Candidatus Omnitrophota bacterium]